VRVRKIEDIDLSLCDFGRALVKGGRHEIAETIVTLAEIAAGGNGGAKSIGTVCMVNNEQTFHECLS
jgi:hypothetical protein